MIKRNAPLKQENVICLYELKSRDSVLRQVDIKDYVSLSYLLKKGDLQSSNLHATNKSFLQPSADRSSLEALISHGWYRYVFKKGLKQRKYNNTTHTTCPISPGRALCYIPALLNQLNLPRTNIYKCTIESDFAIRNHIQIYHKTSFPRIITNDTDLVMLLCDVDCEIELTVGTTCDGKTYFEKRKINPIAFWKRIFRCNLNPDVIKILCVLLGTDYNQYTADSPIHIQHFKDILRILNIKTYDELTSDLLKMHILHIAQTNSDNLNVRETVAALNLYLNNIEGDLQPIDKIDLAFRD
jgi:hypothetical protein